MESTPTGAMVAPQQQRKTPNATTLRVSFHRRVQFRVFYIPPEEMQDRKESLWYSSEELCIIKRLYCRAIVSLDNHQQWFQAQIQVRI